MKPQISTDEHRFNKIKIRFFQSVLIRVYLCLSVVKFSFVCQHI